MFEKNMMTFNHGWDKNGYQIDSFTDLLELQRELKAQAIKFKSETDGSTAEPASFKQLQCDNPIKDIAPCIGIFPCNDQIVRKKGGIKSINANPRSKGDQLIK